LSEKSQSGDKAKDYRKIVKKQLKEWLELIEAAEKSPPGEVMFGDGGDMGMEALLLIPTLLKSQLQFMVDTFDFVAGLPEEKKKEVVEGWAEALKDLPLGSAANSYFRFSRLLWETEGEKLAGAELELARKAVGEIDFGKVRKAVEVKLAARYPVWEGLLDAMVSDPIVIANLMTALPAVLNNLIRLVSFAVSRLELPSEILASAVFNILEDLDVEEVARLTSGLAGTIIALHEGNLILGRSEPRFREVSARLMERYFGAVDWRANHAALVALAEDLEVLIEAFADAAASRPDIMADGVASAIRILASLTRAGSHFALKLQDMPEDLFKEWARALLQYSEPREAGLLLNSLVKLHNRLLDAQPGLGAELLEAAFGAVDTQEFAKAARQGLRQVFTWLARRPDLTSWLEPQEVGRMANSLLQAYNRSAWANGSVKAYASQKLRQLDASELERAAKSAGRQVAEAMAERPEVLRALMRAGISTAWHMLKGLARSLRPGGRG